MDSVTFDHPRQLTYTYQDGDAIKTGTIAIPPTSVPEFRSFFLFSFAKSGSVLVNNLVREILNDCGIPTFDLPSHLFASGIEFDSFLCDLDQAFPEHGYCFSGWRHIPISFYGSNAFKRARKVVITRDPRDILVSLYFSIKYSHSFPDAATSQFNHRVELLRRATELGIDDFCLDVTWLLNAELCYLQTVLNDKDTLVLRYEDFIYDKIVIGRSLRDWCGIDIPDERLREIIRPHDILPEVEQPLSHLRQGHPGDYRRKLRPATVTELNTTLKSFMKTFGYAPLAQVGGEPDGRAAIHASAQHPAYPAGTATGQAQADARAGGKQ
jgi:hypothetical protein